MLRPKEYYEKHLAISLLLGQTVKAIQPEESRIMVERGSDEAAHSLDYSELVLALGATNRRLQGVKEAERLEGVLYLRTLEDARHLAKEVHGKNVAIIGSGFLGFEIASIVLLWLARLPGRNFDLPGWLFICHTRWLFQALAQC